MWQPELRDAVHALWPLTRVLAPAICSAVADGTQFLAPEAQN